MFIRGPLAPYILDGVASLIYFGRHLGDLNSNSSKSQEMGLRTQVGLRGETFAFLGFRPGLMTDGHGPGINVVLFWVGKHSRKLGRYP